MDRLEEKQRAINYIIDEIREGKLIEGSRLISERELSDEIGISRTSTREAISVLRGMGIIESRLGSGNYIVNNTSKSIKEIVEIMIALGNVTIQELIDYRRVISRGVGMRLIENGMSEEYDHRLQQILIEMEDASDEEFCRLDKEFHLDLIRATENTLFCTVMEPVGALYLDMIEEVIIASSNEDRDVRVGMHRDIYKSIQDKDINACIQCMKAHYDYVEKKFKG